MFKEPVAIPVELLEVILLKAIATLYAVYGVHLLLGADVTSLMCVSSVCYEWYAIVTGRKFNRQRLHYLLRKKMEIRGPVSTTQCFNKNFETILFIGATSASAFVGLVQVSSIALVSMLREFNRIFL